MRAVSCLVAIALAWAAAVPAQGLPAAPERSVLVSDLIGLSPAQVRERIGARAPDHDYVTEVRLTDAGEVEVRDTFDIARGGGRCAARSVLTFKLSSDPRRPSFPRFVFRDGRLQQMHPLDTDRPLAADETISIFCEPVRRGDPLGFAIFGPWAAMVAVGRGPESARRASARAELAKLRLGEPPPEGIAEYARRLPTVVQAQAKTSGSTLITVDLGRDAVAKAPDLVQVEVVDGRIVAISKAPLNFVPCWIERDRALHCGATAAPL